LPGVELLDAHAEDGCFAPWKGSHEEISMGSRQQYTGASQALMSLVTLSLATHVIHSLSGKVFQYDYFYLGEISKAGSTKQVMHKLSLVQESNVDRFLVLHALKLLSPKRWPPIEWIIVFRCIFVLPPHFDGFVRLACNQSQSSVIEGTRHDTCFSIQ